MSGDAPLQHCPDTICWALFRYTWRYPCRFAVTSQENSIRNSIAVAMCYCCSKLLSLLRAGVLPSFSRPLAGHARQKRTNFLPAGRWGKTTPKIHWCCDSRHYLMRCPLIRKRQRTRKSRAQDVSRDRSPMMLFSLIAPKHSE